MRTRAVRMSSVRSQVVHLSSPGGITLRVLVAVIIGCKHKLGLFFASGHSKYAIKAWMSYPGVGCSSEA